jgi:hypothetical protein
MPEITNELVEKMNEEVTSDNFWSIVDKYKLETPNDYLHSKLCEQDGVEVWGVTELGEVLVYDCYNGFFLLPFKKWVQEIRNQFDEEANEILRELPVIKNAQIRRPTATMAVEDITNTRRKVHQDQVVNEILGIVQNLEGFYDADMFADLYVKAVNNSLRAIDETYTISKYEVYMALADVDERFRGKYAEGEN